VVGDQKLEGIDQLPYIPTTNHRPPITDHRSPKNTMSRVDNEIRITPSVLDRLIDYEPELSQEPLMSRSKSLRQLKQSVKRDLECLLNTRKVAVELPADLKEINSSLAAYGLPDFTAVNVKSSLDQDRMRRELETAIRTFEPRLEDVTVSLEPMRETERALHFRIDARLRVEPAPEPIMFDTVLRLDNGRYSVEEK
jgi:type VI secretion system protein ImpF